MSSTCPARSRRRCWSARSPSGMREAKADGQEGALGRRPGGRAHRRRAGDGRAGRGRLRRRAVRRQRAGHPRHRVGAVRHLARRRPGPGPGVEHGHEHHIRAINTIRKAGSIAAAVEPGVLTGGIMHALVTQDKEFVLVGSVRDDGPLPDVYTDVIEGQRAMRAAAARRRLLPHGRDDAALGRDRQHPARRRSRWCASTSTRRPSPSSPTAAPRRRAASSPTSACSSSSSPASSPPSDAARRLGEPEALPTRGRGPQRLTHRSRSWPR